MKVMLSARKSIKTMLQLGCSLDTVSLKPNQLRARYFKQKRSCLWLVLFRMQMTQCQDVVVSGEGEGINS